MKQPLKCKFCEDRLLQKYTLNEKEKHINKHIHLDKGFKSDETTVEGKGLNLYK